MLHHPKTCRQGVGLLCAGVLLFGTSASGFAAPRPAQASSSSPPRVVSSRKLKPRDRVAPGDRWRVRVSQYPMHIPEATWQPPETWVFAAGSVERTEDGPRLIVTATREGATRPTVFLQLDPETGAVTRADTVIPTQGGERLFTEKAKPGEPFVPEMSPVPIAIGLGAVRPNGEAAAGKENRGTSPTDVADLSHGSQGDGGNTAQVLTAPPAATAPSGPSGSEEDTGEKKTENSATSAPEMAFGGGFTLSFGRRASERTEPIDAAVGRAKIQSGLRGLDQPRGGDIGPIGVPRFLTVIEGPGLRVEQLWDETTPWPLYSQTNTSRCWLVAYTRGKSS